MANTHGNSVEEMQVYQRLAPNQTKIEILLNEGIQASTGVIYSSNPYFDGFLTIEGGIYPARTTRMMAQQTISSSDIALYAQRKKHTDLLRLRAKRSKCNFVSLATIQSFDPKSLNTAKYEKNKGARVRKQEKEYTKCNANYDQVITRLQEARELKKPVEHLRLTLQKIKKEKKKKEKWNKSASIQTSLPSKSYGNALLDGLHAVIQYVDTVREVVGDDILAFLMDLFTTLYNIYQRPTWDTTLVNMTSLFIRHFPRDLADYAIAIFRTVFELASSQGDGDSYKEFLMSLFTNSSEFLDDALWSNIAEFFVKIAALYGAMVDAVSLEALDMTTLLKNFKIFKSSLPDIKDLIEMAFLAYEFVLGSWENIRTGNWSKLLLGKDETKEFEVEVRLLEQAFPLIIANQEIELKTIYNLTPKQYESRLAAAIKHATSLIHRCTSVQQRMSVSNFIKTLTDKQSEIYARIADAPRREEPYSVKLSGPSGCGKSTLVSILSRTILNAYGHDPNERGQVVFTNISEKYESTIKPSHKIIVADDMANNKNEKPNYDRILNYVNTVPRPLEKADVKEKGILYPGNCAFMGTTNDETLRAQECSSCPESIYRRFALDVEVHVREEYRNSYQGLIRLDKPQYDVYQFVLKRFDSIDQEGNIIWNIIPRKEWNSFDDDEHDFAALTKFIALDVKNHTKRVQSQALAQQELDDCVFCTECGCPSMLCYCSTKEPADIQFGTFWSTFGTAELWDIRAAMGGARIAASTALHKGLFYAKVWKERRNICKNISMLFGAIILGSIFTPKLAQPAVFVGVMRLVMIYQKMLREIDEEIIKRNDRLSSLCVDTRVHLRTNMLAYFAAGTAILTLYKGYQIIKPLLCLQDKSSYFEKVIDELDTSLDSPPVGEFVYDIQDQRDYKEGYSRLTPKETSVSKTTTSSDLQLALAKALRVVVVKTRGQVYGSVNGIMIESNIIMVPAHVVPYTFPFDIETSSTPGVPSASTKDQKLTEDFVSIDRERDVAFIHLASSPASTPFSQFFPQELPSFYGRTTTMLWKSPSNEVKKSTQVARQLAKDTQYGGWLEHPGLLYGERKKLTMLTLKKGNALRVDLQFPSFNGLCGGLYVDDSAGIIYGFHVAGFPNSHAGFLTCITKPMIDIAIEKIRKTSPTLVVHSCGTVKVNTYDTPFALINSKPLYLRDDGTKEKTTVTFLGSVLKDGQPLENRTRSPYVKTPFLGVTEEFGVSKHRPPTKPNDVAKGMKTLNKLTNPVQHYEGDLLIRAAKDYKDQTLQVIRENREEVTEMLRIYSQEEAMDGIGQFGLGGLPSSTSAGFPINKTKKHCLVRDVMDESLVKVPREFNDRFEIQNEIDRIEKCWKEEIRSESIYKASSKVNELLPNAKALDKVRKFYGSGFANFVASRKTLAGVPRFMRRFWHKTECLVGIDPMSREWASFHEYLTEYSTTNMIAGDFSGFDTRMAAQITGAAAQIMISWYEEVGCTKDEIVLIRGALSDIIHPNILFDGDLYRFANGNPSGNLITVQLNSICNSLMMRYVYYAMMPNIKETFSQNVCLGTYGDDNAMSVKHHCKWYTHTTCQAEFEKLDIGYTMAEKTAQSVHYIPIEEISFLKRKFVFHETLKTIVAPIEEDSILKKFYYIKKPNESPLCPGEQFGAYTDGSFREAYLHGREYYENFVSQIRRIVDLNPELQYRVSFVPYDEMTYTLSFAYAKDYVNNNKKLFAESCGLQGED